MPQQEGYEDALNLTISLCLTYTLCIACVRIWIRKGSFGSDDLVIAVATLVTLCNSAASYAALAKGLGTSWSRLKQSGTISSLNGVSIPVVPRKLSADWMSRHR